MTCPQGHLASISRLPKNLAFYCDICSQDIEQGSEAFVCQLCPNKWSSCLQHKPSGFDR
jgi:hypothetical protein